VVCLLSEPTIKTWKERYTALTLEGFTRQPYLANRDRTPLRGVASKRMYRFVRWELGVPFLQVEGACAQGRK